MATAVAHPTDPSSSKTNGSTAPPQRLSKNAKRRAKKKQDKVAEPESSSSSSSAAAATAAAHASSSSFTPSVSDVARPVIQDFQADLPEDDEAFKQFQQVFAKFQAPAGLGDDESGEAGPSKGQVIYSDEEDMSDSDATRSDGEDGVNGHARAFEDLSRRRQKKLSRLTVAELKQIVRRPEVVDWSDVTAADPKLLVAMKSAKNSVPIPVHWSQKREYLQNKRGIEKAPYELPSYIADTGIGTMKDALREKEAEQSLRTKTRERVQPKMGKIGTDYQKLHDAFFRFQTKPPLSAYGETYYEGKEYEHKFKERQPGDLSSELKEALSIPPLAPPPWLIAMQRFGPPPSYPHLKIPGLNAPIPQGAQWGFHPGGWGRPPVDEFGNPLYGEVMGYGETPEQQRLAAMEEPVQRQLFGELESESEEEEDDDDDNDDEDEDSDEQRSEAEEPDQDDTTGKDAQQRDYPADGLETPGGLASVASTLPGGLETPDFLELRKQGRGGTATPAMRDVRPGSSNNDQSQQRSLYQVIPETQQTMTGFMGSDRGYDLRGPQQAPQQAMPVLGADDTTRGTKRKGGGGSSGVEVTFDPSELEGMSESELQHRYDQAQRAQREAAAARGGGAAGAGTLDTSGENLAVLREELSRKRKVTEERRREARRGGGGGEEEQFKF